MGVDPRPGAPGPRAAAAGRSWIAATLARVVTRLTDGSPPHGPAGASDAAEVQRLLVELAASEARIRFLADNATDVIIHAGPDRRVQYVTPSSGALLDLTPDDLIGVPVIDLVHPDHRPEVEAAFTDAVDTGSIMRVETRVLQAATGAATWVEFTVRAVIVPVEPYELEFHVTLHDIAERRAALAALADAEAKLRGMSDGASDVIYRLRLDTLGFEYVNPAITPHTGLSPDEIYADAGGAVIRLIHPDDLPTLSAFLSGEHTAADERIEMRWMHHDGTATWAEHHVTLQRDDTGRPLVLDGIARDITEVKRTEQELRELAHSDALTGLPNRRAVLAILQRRIAAAEAVVALFIDLDGFKAVNDTLGHEAGDELLIAVSDRLRSAARSEDVVARLAGDEFLVLTSLRGARPLSERIVDELIWPFELKAGTARISASIGTATAQPGEDPDAVLRRADIGMYEAKQAGRVSRRSWARVGEADDEHEQVPAER